MRCAAVLVWGAATLLFVVPASAAKFAFPPPEVVASLPNTTLDGVASDGAGGVWFNEQEHPGNIAEAYMAHYSPAAPGIAKVHIWPEPGQQPDNGEVFGIAAGLNGDEWFTRPFQSQVSRISADGTVTDFNLGGNASPNGVVVDPSGTVWVSISGGTGSVHIDRLAPDGEIQDWPSGGGEPGFPIFGPDGNIWLTGFTAGVNDISATSPELVKNYPLANSSGEFASGVASQGGKVWATIGGNSPRIEAISPAGATHDYKLSRLSPQSIVAGPDGALWFTAYDRKSSRSVLARLTTSGSLSTLTLGVNESLAGLAASGNAIYLTDGGTQPKLLRISLAAALNEGYVALGDSYSSGEGDPPYEAATEEKNWDECHRSEAAYPRLLDRALGLGPLSFVACSGAVTDNLFRPNGGNHEAEQYLALNNETKTVTLTVGGNDVGFPEVLEHCVEGLQVSGDGWPYTQGAECSTNQQLVELVTNRRKVLEGKLSPSALTSGPPVHPLSEVISQIHKEAPSARIVIGGYPLLFGPKTSTYESHPTSADGSEYACRVWSAFGKPAEWVLYSDAQWLNSQGQLLDSALQSAVAVARSTGINVRYAPPSGFKGHGLCDKHEAWFHELVLDFHDSSPYVTVNHESFHPTANGQGLGYEPAFAKQLK